MNPIKNLTDVLSNSLTTTLDVEYQGYMQYVQMLKRLEKMSPLEFTYYDDLNVPRVLKVPPITLVPLTMLHIKRASFDYSVAVNEVESSSQNGGLVEPGLAMEEAKKEALKMCKYDKSLPRSTTKDISTGIIQVGIFNVDKMKASYTKLAKIGSTGISLMDFRLKKRVLIRNTKRIMAEVELNRVLSLLKPYDGKPFILMDETFYFPAILGRFATSESSEEYSFQGFTLGRKGGSVPTGSRLSFCPVEIGSGTNPFALLDSQIRDCLQYAFYQDGSAMSAAGEKLVPVPSTAGMTPLFSASFIEGRFSLICESKVFYAPEVERKVISRGITVKSEKRNNSNLKVTVKMGQAGISQGVISLLNSKNRTNLNK